MAKKKKSRKGAAEDAAIGAAKFSAKATVKTVAKTTVFVAAGIVGTAVTGGLGGLAMLVGVGILTSAVLATPVAVWQMNRQGNFNKIPELTGNLKPGDIVIFKDFSKASKLQVIQHPKQTYRALKDDAGSPFFAHGIGIVEFIPPTGEAVRISMSDESHGQRVWCYDNVMPLLVFRFTGTKKDSHASKLAQALDTDYYSRKKNFTPSTSTWIMDGASAALRKGKNAVMRTDEDDGFLTYEDKSGAITEEYKAYDPAWFVIKMLKKTFKRSELPPQINELYRKGRGRVTISDLEKALYFDNGSNFVLAGRVGTAIQGVVGNAYFAAKGEAYVGGSDSSSSSSSSSDSASFSP